MHYPDIKNIVIEVLWGYFYLLELAKGIIISSIDYLYNVVLHNICGLGFYGWLRKLSIWERQLCSNGFVGQKFGF